MGLRFRKSINLGHGLRMNLSKSGVGFSAGTKGFRVTKTANGRVRTTASIPRSGISYVKETSSKKTKDSTNNAIGGNEMKQKKKHPILKKILIVLAVFFVIGGILTALTGNKLEEITISGIPNSMDIDQTRSIDFITNPSDYDISDAELKTSDDAIAKLVFKNGKLYIETNGEGNTTVWIEKDNIISNKLKVNVIDVEKAEKEAQLKAEQEQAEKEAQLKAKQEQAEKEAQNSTVIPYASSNSSSSSSNNSVSGNTSSNQEIPEVDHVSSGVYIAGSGNGTKYHSNPNCSNMKNPIEISLSEAQARGYEPCKKCY